MALHHDTQIYAAVVELGKFVLQAVRQMPRDVKLLLGGTLRRRTFNDALHRLERMPAERLNRSANSYFGLLRQATHSHRDRARLASLVRRRGLAVDHRLTKAYA